MADNTDHTIQNAPSTPAPAPEGPKEGDMNYIKRESGKSYGCNTGQHDFALSDADISVGEEGLTALKVTCVLCGAKAEIQADLNLNDLIQKYDVDKNTMARPAMPVQPRVITPPQPAQPQQYAPQHEVGNSEILDKLFGR